MKHIHKASKGDRQGIVREYRGSLLVMKRLYSQVKRCRSDGLKQGRRIFKKLREVDESISMIACELARQAKAHKQ